MLRRAWFILAALFIAAAYIWVKGSGLENPTTLHLPDPASQSLGVRISVDILEEWLRSALVALPFAIAIALIYKRSWLWVSVLVALPTFALNAYLSNWFGCGHRRWVVDCVQWNVGEAFVLPLVTLLVVKVATHARAL